MKIEDALSKLYSLHQFGVKLGLENIVNLLDYIGNPHKKLKCFHIAGSNGKGSTACFIASILTEMGYKIGLYTSPHFVRFNERIQINGAFIDDEYIAEFVNEVDEYIDKYKPTFFELTTALAFKYFAGENVHYAVIETGLGGRLDATNVIYPLASVITSISREHTNVLTDDIKTIAYEKAGIIKENSTALWGILAQEASERIQQIAGERNCRAFPLKENIIEFEDHICLQLEQFKYYIYRTSLTGKIQIYNAALAALTVDKILGIDDCTVLNNGIKNIVLNTNINGRYEIFSAKPKIIFDSAHNPEALEVFLKEFEKEPGIYINREVIYAAMKDKNIKEMILNLSEHFNRILVTDIPTERGARKEEIEEIAKKMNITVNKLDSPADYIFDFKERDANHCLVVLGSIYLLGEIKKVIHNKKT